MPELTAGRFFQSYGASMDAALQSKVQDIEPWLLPGLVVDRGCGTGSFMKYLAARNRKVVGVELSDELSRLESGVIQANVMAPVFADGFVENIVLSSVMHEVFSYSDCSMAAVVVCLSNCARELKRGGRIIVRDIWSPEPLDSSGASNDGLPRGGWHKLEMEPGPWDRLMDLVERSPVPLDCVDVDTGARRATLSTQTAVEFLSKKDYDEHWELELKEVYTSVPMSMYREIASTLGLEIVHAQPLRNEWIVKNRWQKGVKGELPEYTNMIVVMQKV